MNGTKSVAEAIVRADNWFIEICTKRGFTADEAFKIFAVYKKVKAIKRDHIAGNYQFKHGVYLELDVMRNAVINHDAIMNNKKGK